MKKEGLNEKQIQDNTKKLKEIYNPQTQLIGIFASTTINGVIISIVIAALASRKKKPPEPELIPEQETLKQQ